MSRVQLTILENGAVQAEFSLDLSREMGSSQSYYELSQDQNAPHNPIITSILARLMSASELQHANQRLDWQLIQVDFPDNPKEDFFNGLSWPMTHIILHSHLLKEPINSDNLSVAFSGQFLFEEPIAVSFLQQSTGRKMSRWLVPNQQSPLFNLALNQDENGSAAHSMWQWQMWFDYIYLGMKHIIPLGLDHVLFVLALFLGTRSFKQLLCLVTGFTAAHSVTLALASYGAIKVSAAIVEPLIAFSIFWMALENILFRQPGFWRFATVFIFGLLHGLGFAQALRELGLPSDSFITSLISFNVGIELAQISVVVLAFVLVGWVHSKDYWRRRIVIPASTIIAIVAFYWTVSRFIV
jgi:hypothetical protein